jgi:hypothetical protein
VASDFVLFAKYLQKQLPLKEEQIGFSDSTGTTKVKIGGRI